jgi:hypothetical protein
MRRRRCACIYDAFGAKRLMWGTDWPISLGHLSYAQTVALFRDHMSTIPEAEHPSESERHASQLRHRPERSADAEDLGAAVMMTSCLESSLMASR